MKIKSIVPQIRIFLQDSIGIPIMNIKETNLNDSAIESKYYNSMSLYLLHNKQLFTNSTIKLKEYSYIMNVDIGSIGITAIIAFEDSLIEAIVKNFMGVTSIANNQKEELYLDGANEFIHTIMGLAVPKYMDDTDNMNTHSTKRLFTVKDIDIPNEHSMLQEDICTKYGYMSVCIIEGEIKKNSSLRLDKKKILVVDDSLMIVSKMKVLLNELGHDVITARSAKEAIEIYKIEKPDFVTMDVNMPEMSGIEALKHIIEIDSNAKVVMITSDGQESIMMESFKYGALNFILKPITFNKLVKVIDDIYTKDENEAIE